MEDKATQARRLALQMEESIGDLRHMANSLEDGRWVNQGLIDNLRFLLHTSKGLVDRIAQEQSEAILENSSVNPWAAARMAAHDRSVMASGEDPELIIIDEVSMLSSYDRMMSLGDIMRQAFEHLIRDGGPVFEYSRLDALQSIPRSHRRPSVGDGGSGGVEGVPQRGRPTPADTEAAALSIRSCGVDTLPKEQSSWTWDDMVEQRDQWGQMERGRADRSARGGRGLADGSKVRAFSQRLADARVGRRSWPPGKGRK